MVGFGIGFRFNSLSVGTRSCASFIEKGRAGARPYQAIKILLVILLLIQNTSHADCSRIISLSPSITEILFQINLGSKVVGVSDYDVFPDEVKKLPRVGPSLSPSLEAILRLKPSSVFLLTEHREIAERVKSLGIEVKYFDHRSVRGIIESIKQIGTLCHVDENANKLEDLLANAIKDAERKQIKKDIPVLFIVGRDYASSTLKDIYLSGKDGFYNELVKYAGGTNVVREDTIGLKGLALEALIRLSPKIIIEIVPPETHLTEDQLKLAWSDFKSVEAVRDNRIYFLRGDWAYTPGPRFPILLNRLIEIIQ